MADIIMKVVDWLNTNSGPIIAIGTVAVAAATVVLVGVTIFYAWVTKKMLEENRQMRIDAQKPEIVIYPYLDVSHRLFAHVDLLVENIGRGAAYDVKFTTDLSFSLNEKKPLEKAPFLRYGISCFLPGERRTHNLNNAPPLGFNEISHQQIKIEVFYKDLMSQTYERCFCINFREYTG